MTSLVGVRRALLAAIACGVWASGASAIPLVQVSGSGDAGEFIDLNQAAAVAFSLDQAYTNVAISAEILCIDCSGEVILMEGDIGPTATLANFVTGVSFDVFSPVDPLLSGLNLSAGDYFLIIAMTDAGSAGWIGSSAPVITTATGTAAGLNFFATSLDTPAYNSDFEVILGPDGLHFAVTGDFVNGGGAPVPAPPAWWSVAGGLAVLALIRRREPGGARAQRGTR